MADGEFAAPQFPRATAQLQLILAAILVSPIRRSRLQPRQLVQKEICTPSRADEIEKICGQNAMDKRLSRSNSVAEILIARFAIKGINILET